MLTALLLIVGMILCVAIVAFGFWLIIKFPIPGIEREKMSADFFKAKIDGPVGAVLILGPPLILAALLKIYSGNLESENSAYKTKNEGLNSDVIRLNGDIADLKDDAGKQKKRADDLEGRLLAAEQEVQKAWLLYSRSKLSKDEQAELDRLNQGLEALNGELTLLRVRMAPWPVIVGQEVRVVYEIYRKSFETDKTSLRGFGLFDFDAERYTIKGDILKNSILDDLDTNIGRAICGGIERAINKTVSLNDAFARVPELQGLDYQQLLGIVKEYKYLEWQIQRLSASALVTVTGYADGEVASWERKLEFPAKAIQLHESADPSYPYPLYPLTYKANLSRVALGRPPNYTAYANVDLPNLRAAEVQILISRLADSCARFTGNTFRDKIPVQILEGRTYQALNENDRKTRVHVLVSLK
jgi:hypothetical protein